MNEIQTSKKEISDNLGFFRFKKIEDKYLLTNDVGDYVFLTKNEFDDFTQGKIDKEGAVYAKLRDKNFIKDELNYDYLIERYKNKQSFLKQGTSLHIVVVTHRCDHRCVYCQTSSSFLNAENKDMDKDTAKKVVDVIFDSPSPHINIEFQGGEPLLNWEIVKFVIEYSEEKNEIFNKNLMFSLISNLTFLTEEKLQFLLFHKVSLCTSLDGPEYIHNKNRIATTLPNGAYTNVKKWIDRIQELKKQEEQKNGELPYRMEALVTVSRFTLPYAKELINEYIDRGYCKIHLRPLSQLGFSSTAWSQIGYSHEEFIKFYKECLDYIIDLNLQGKEFYERTARIILTKIFLDFDPNYLELRSPCGAGIGQMLYNYDGKVFTCDEGRMLGNDTFVIGDVHKDNYEQIVSHETVKLLCVASCLDGLECDSCVYKPYCGVCPIANYAENGNIFAQMPKNIRCQINQAIFGYIFYKLQEEKVNKVFNSWFDIKEKLA